MNKLSLIILAAAIAIAAALTLLPRGASQTVDVKLPEKFSDAALDGRTHFEQNCQSCHGVNAAGTSTGPPLVHKIYEPSHHSDKSFHRAVRNGVQPHHWQFGQMPPIDHVEPKQVELIITYVRELQRANGIF